MQIAEVKNISFRYTSEYVLENINFSINKGDFVGLIGPNGGGKTTIIKLMMGILKPTRGEIGLFGENPLFSKNKSKIGYIPQRTAGFDFDFPATAQEIVSLGLLVGRKFPRKIDFSDKAKVYNAMKLADVLPFAGKLIGHLSGGQLQRVFLAKMIACEPEILFLDEPTNALDYKTRQKFMDLIINLNKEKKVTVIFITHDNTQISKYANTLLVVDTKMLFCGSPLEFCKSRDMEKYFGAFSQHLICHRHDEAVEKLWK
jgi:zinc transport system ATP-binding protein